MTTEQKRDKDDFLRRWPWADSYKIVKELLYGKRQDGEIGGANPVKGNTKKNQGTAKRPQQKQHGVNPS